MKRMDTAGFGNKAVSRRWWGKVAGMMGLAAAPSSVAGNQGRGRMVGPGRSTGQLFEAMERRTMMSTGVLDTTFNGTGKFTYDYVANTGNYEEVAVVRTQADGKVILAGYNTWNSNFGVIRLNTNGTLDTTFGTNGLANLPGSLKLLSNIAVQSDDKIVLGCANADRTQSVVVRLTANGVLDSGFGSNGIFTTNLSSSTEYVTDVVVQSDGKIVAVCDAQMRSGVPGTDPVVIRLTTAGVLDTTFNGNGIKPVLVGVNGASGEEYQISIQADGKYVIGGNEWDYLPFLARVNTNGTTDTSFGSSGVFIDSGASAVATAGAIYLGLDIQSNGRIILSGQAYTGSTDYMIAFGYTPSGALDTGFASSGRAVISYPGATYADGWNSILQWNDKILLVGDSNPSVTSDIAMVRLTFNGVLDTTFDGDGRLTTDVSVNDLANSVWLQKDGKILAAGGANYGTTSSKWAAVRYTNDDVPGTPDLIAGSDSGSSSTDNITNDNTPTFNGSLGVANAQVQIYANNVLVASGTADASGNYSLTTTVLADGTYSIVTQARAGVTNPWAQSGVLSVVVDTVAPAAPTTAPDMTAASDTGSSSTDNITKTTTPVFTGTTTANTSIQLLAGTTVVASGTTSGTGTYSLTSSTLADGNYNMVVRLVDVAGNISSNSSALAITIDSAAPAAPATPDMTAASDTGSSNTDNITSNNTPVFTGTAAVGATVTLLASGTSVGTATADASGNWSITSSSLADGNYNITATATDTAGNVSAASSALAITIDTTVPVHKEVAGYVAIQAEVYSRAVTGTGTASNGVNLATLNWQYGTQSSYGGMRVPNAGATNTNVGDSTQANAGPRLEYDVNITTAGNYYLWVRMYGATGSDDSIHVSFDNNTILTTSGNGMSSQSSLGAWAWINKMANNGVTVILNNVTAGTHTLKLWMREDGAWVDQMVLRTAGGSTAPATDNNLALGRNAVASSSVAGFAPSNAVDGSTSSLWTSTAAGTQTLTVDLGASFVLNRIKLTWGSNYATGYKIWVGSSAAFGAGTYTEYNPGAQNGGVDDLTALSLTGRYVRIVMETPVSGATSYQLGELEVYGA